MKTKENKMGKILLAALISSLSFALFADDGTRTKEQAQAFVKKAIGYTKEVGKEKALKEFSKTLKDGGKFIDGELYVLALDTKGVTLAHGGKPVLVGNNMWELKDKKGNKLVQDIINTAVQKGSGFTEYCWENPTHGNVVEQKVTYTEKIDEMVIAAGVYVKNSADKCKAQ